MNTSYKRTVGFDDSVVLGRKFVFVDIFLWSKIMIHELWNLYKYRFYSFIFSMLFNF